MAEPRRKNTYKKNNNKSRTKTAVAVIVSVVLIFCLGAVILTVSSVLHKKASEKLDESMYPLEYEKYVEKYSKEFDVDKCLVYGVIKTESGFDPNAESPVGAIGLMQLMPDTFTWIQNYRTQFMPDKILDSQELYDPKLNIEYGVYLLRYLLDMYDGNTDLAICSYNAGNGNIDDWLAQGIITPDNVDPDNIPFEETANYLRRVRSAMDKYRELYFPDYAYTYSKVEWEDPETAADTQQTASADYSEIEYYNGYEVDQGDNNEYDLEDNYDNYNDNNYYEGNYYDDEYIYDY